VKHACLNVGQQYGRWTVLQKADHRHWLCRCSCGTEKCVYEMNLKLGKSKSCGCYRGDMKSNCAMLLARHCEYCQKIFWIKYSHIHKRGKYCSRKCLDLSEHNTRNTVKYPHVLPGNLAARNRLLKNYRQAARKRHLEWNIADNVFFMETKRNCFYCGLGPSSIMVSGNQKQQYVYNGIDRANNALGYIDGNIVACCKTCNRAKGTLSQDDFISLAARIYSIHIPEKRVA
jgi:hypothetical protein